MVDKVIKGRLADGQLDECPLTLDDLRKIKGTVDGNSGMIPVLRGIYPNMIKIGRASCRERV